MPLEPSVGALSAAVARLHGTYTVGHNTMARLASHDGPARAGVGEGRENRLSQIVFKTYSENPKSV